MTILEKIIETKKIELEIVKKTISIEDLKKQSLKFNKVIENIKTNRNITRVRNFIRVCVYANKK